jgi:hypothetical protein
LISSAASIAEETSGFFQISQWWIGLIAWGLGVILFVVGLSVGRRRPAVSDGNRRSQILNH